MAELGYKKFGEHNTKTIGRVLKQARGILLRGKTPDMVFPAAPEISSEMTIEDATRFVKVKGLRTENGKLLAVVKRVDHNKETTEQVMLSGRRLCISVHEKNFPPSGRNHLIWLE